MAPPLVSHCGAQRDERTPHIAYHMVLRALAALQQHMFQRQAGYAAAS